jgi:Arc/MetJ-type ribon-helix-helix transcriptional regulator
MLIYVRIEDALKKQADELVSRGLYPDFNTVVMVALQNLLVAEQDAAQGAGHQIAPYFSAQQVVPVAPVKAITEPSSKPERSKSVEWDSSITVPAKLITPFPSDLFRPDQTVPVEKWVFGQQNRVLPAKINARLFITLIAERGTEVELFEAANEISTRAALVFEFLSGLDQRFGHGKDDLLSTGFPEPGSEKAISRYANHFAAYESTQGNLTGMLIQWKLVGVKRVKNKTYLLPTQACIDFAALVNPLLDQPVNQKPNEKFSGEEMAWAVEHIRKHVPVEASAFTTILNGLQAGFTTPDAIDGFVREHAREKTDVSPAFISTQRSGAFSRMADLNLVKRQRDGTKVIYEITELGNNWLKNQTGKNSKK